jgi:hypothetical protein
MKYINVLTGIIIIGILFFSCDNKKTHITKPDKQESIDQDIKTIHIFTALCDNRYQGITRVSASLGNGQNQNMNLYWGALYGVRTYFKKSNEWELLAAPKVKGVILERLVFKHTSENYYLIADAYNGRYIKQCTIDFLNSVCGSKKDILQINGKTLGISGNASLLAYVGHNGLMDFQLSEIFLNTDNIKRDVIILACYSKRYFSPHLEKANVNPLVWTTNLMAPEAYTLHGAISGYINGEANEEIRERAAVAYAKYQKCGINAAKGLLVTDW